MLQAAEPHLKGQGRGFGIGQVQCPLREWCGLCLRGADATQFPDRSRFVSLHTDGALSSSENAAARLVRYLNQADFGNTVVDDLRH